MLKGDIAAMDVERGVISSGIVQSERRRSLGSPSSACRDRCLELSAASAGTVCRKLVDYSATSAGTVINVKNSGLFCDECRDGCQKLGVFRGKYGDGKVRKLAWTLQEDLWRDGH